MPMHLYIKGNYSWKPRILSFLAIFLKKISILCSGWNILVGTLEVKWNGNLKVEMLRAFSLLVRSNIFVCVKSGEHWVMTKSSKFWHWCQDLHRWVGWIWWKIQNHTFSKKMYFLKVVLDIILVTDQFCMKWLSPKNVIFCPKNAFFLPKLQ